MPSTEELLLQALKQHGVGAAAKADTTFKDVAIERDGEKIILPALPREMTLNEGVSALQRLAKEEEAITAINEVVRSYPLDGAVALMRVLKRRFGWTNLIPTPGFFGDKPPAQVGVEIGYKQTIQVPWGRMQVPGVEGFLATGWNIIDNMPVFVISGEVKRRSEALVHAIAEDVRKEVADNSIYRHQAVRLTYRHANGDLIDDEDFNPYHGPRFLDLSGVDENQAVFAAEASEQINTSLFTPIVFSDRCRKHRVPLKRGVLLEGKFGTGKTLTAMITAHKCVSKESDRWTFCYLDDVRDLDRAIKFAKEYGPAVIFAEDVDRVVSGERNEDMDRVLNTIDGVDSKDSELIVVLTTNSVEKIHPAFIRPGRIDAVISIAPPDAQVVVKLIRKYGGTAIQAEDEDLLEVVGPIIGQNAAVTREVVERAKLSAIQHSSGELEIYADDIKSAVISMAKHLELLNPAQPEEIGAGERFMDAIADKVMESIREAQERVERALASL